MTYLHNYEVLADARIPRYGVVKKGTVVKLSDMQFRCIPIMIRRKLKKVDSPSEKKVKIPKAKKVIEPKKVVKDEETKKVDKPVKLASPVKKVKAISGK